MRRLSIVLLFALSGPVCAATYQVGPTRTHTNLDALFAAVDLGPGDVVEVDGDVIYDVGSPGVVVPSSDGGAAGNPVILRGVRVNGRRPHLRGGTNTIEFRLSDHVVFEGFEVSGTGTPASGTFRCVYHHAHDIVIRDAYIHDCPRHGILGADQDSGSLLVEYTEVFNAGSNGGNHAIYMATDEVAHPGSVFRLQYSYVHDSQFDPSVIGGNLIKSRAERNEIYYNWLEGAFYHELELIGPDPNGAAAGWDDALAREDSDVVGNVIFHTTTFGSVVRFGGDATGHSAGRYRVVNNTIVVTDAGAGGFTIFRLFDPIESLELHNNAIWRAGASSVTLVRAVTGEVVWATGSPRVTGTENWIKSGFAFNPANLPHTISGTATGADPGFASLAGYDLAPGAGSPLLDVGNAAPVAPAGYEIANPLFPPTRHPPVRAPIPAGGAAARVANGVIDVGAFERVDAGLLFGDGFESG
jgi:hypothetical protein